MLTFARHEMTREELIMHLKRFIPASGHGDIVDAYHDLIWDDEIATGTPVLIDVCRIYQPSNYDPLKLTQLQLEFRFDGINPGDPCYYTSGVLSEGPIRTKTAMRRRHKGTFIEDLRAFPEVNAVEGPRFAAGRRCCLVDIEGKGRFMVHASNIRHANKI